jgi:hypothetical protein
VAVVRSAVGFFAAVCSTAGFVAPGFAAPVVRASRERRRRRAPRRPARLTIRLTLLGSPSAVVSW